MKYILTFSICLCLMYGCREKKVKIIEKSSKYCDNELELINSFDSLPTWNRDFKFINVDIEEHISIFFTGDLCCEDLRFNVYHTTDYLDSIKFSLNYYFNCSNCPAFIREVNNCIILLNSKGQILFEGEFISPDSLDKELINYYLQVGTNNNFPDSYDKTNIVLQWDSDVSQINFTSFINQIIKGYLNFAGEYSNKTYQKRLCELNKNELNNLSQNIPFKVEIPTFHEVVND